MRRVHPAVWALAALVVAAGALNPVSEPASLAVGVLAAVLALGLAIDALGVTSFEDPGHRPENLREQSERRRLALRRFHGDRDRWQKAPDAPDEPIDAIWSRERSRRAATRE